MIEEYRHDLLDRFAGLPVFDVNFDFALGHEYGHTHNHSHGSGEGPHGVREAGTLPADVEEWAWRVSADYPDDRSFAEVLDELLDRVGAGHIRALILGIWYTRREPMKSSAEAIAAVADRAGRLTGLEALFVGDVSSDQSEISWLRQADPGRLFEVFPGLREFGLRGSTDLSMAPLEHERLEELTLQSGGLPPAVVRAVAASHPPSPASTSISGRRTTAAGPNRRISNRF